MAVAGTVGHWPSVSGSSTHWSFGGRDMVSIGMPHTAKIWEQVKVRWGIGGDHHFSSCPTRGLSVRDGDQTPQKSCCWMWSLELNCPARTLTLSSGRIWLRLACCVCRRSIEFQRKPGSCQKLLLTGALVAEGSMVEELRARTRTATSLSKSSTRGGLPSLAKIQEGRRCV